MNSDSGKYVIARVGYKLIVEWGFSLNKASKYLKMSKTTLRRYINTYIKDADEIAAIELALATHKQSNKAYTDIVIENMIASAKSSVE